MTSLRALLPALLSCLTLACDAEDPPQTEIWDVRANPNVCDNGVDYQFCRNYVVVETDEPGTLYQTVKGFEPDWGYTYRIEVEITEVEFFLDGSSVAYELVEIIDQEAQPGHEFNMQLLLTSIDVEQSTGDAGYGLAFTCAPEQCTEVATALEQGEALIGTFRFGPSEALLLPLELVAFAPQE